ncbi:hypothetical protein ACQ4LK_24915, partial [Bacillus pumilus]
PPPPPHPPPPHRPPPPRFFKAEICIPHHVEGLVGSVLCISEIRNTFCKDDPSYSRRSYSSLLESSAYHRLHSSKTSLQSCEKAPFSVPVHLLSLIHI